MLNKRKKGQIWIETVIYTLIGLTIIGISLSIIKPAIDEKKDKAIIEQSIELLKSMDSEIDEVIAYGSGNVRTLDFKIKSGKMLVVPAKDSVEFRLSSRKKYSQQDKQIVIARNINITTVKKGNTYEVYLNLSYDPLKYDFRWNNASNDRVFSSAPTNYKIIIENFTYHFITNLIF